MEMMFFILLAIVSFYLGYKVGLIVADRIYVGMFADFAMKLTRYDTAEIISIMRELQNELKNKPINLKS